MWGQQQQAYGQQAAAPQQQAWGQQAQPVNKDVILVVTGCTHGTVGGIVRGSFQLFGENHGKPTYKKDGQVNGMDVMSYYWDERDGPNFCGWWFGPIVGGDQVWAYHADKSAPIPPESGWKVPYDGAVDATMSVARKPKVAAAPVQMPQQAWGQQQQMPQQQMQNKMPQQQMPQQAWGQPQQQMQQQVPQQAWGQPQQQMQQQAQGGWQQDQRAQLEALKKQQAADQAMRLQAQQAATQAENAKRIEQQRKNMEAMKAQQQEAIRKRAEDQAKQQAAQAIKKIEQMAILNIRKVVQKFRASALVNYDANKAELDAALAKETANLGSQQATITKEVEQAVEQTKKRLEQVREAAKKKEEAAEAEKLRRRDLNIKATNLVTLLEEMVTKTEASIKSTAEEAEPLTSDKELKLAQLEAAASALQEAGKDASELLQQCSDFVVKEQANMRSVVAIPGEPAPTCAADLQQLLGRINDGKKNHTKTINVANAAKATRVKKAHAKEKYEKGFAAFKKADTDKDGKLSRKEIQAYAKAEFKFAVPAETLDMISSVLIKDDSKGVEKTAFHKLRVMIGVAREAALDKKRREDKNARANEVEKLKEKLQARLTKAGEQVTEAVEAAATAEKAAAANGNAVKSTSVDMVAAADEADAVIEKSTKIVAVAKEAITKVSAETEPELKAFLNTELKKLQGLLSPADAKIVRSAGAVKAFRAAAAKKNALELEKLRADGLAMIFHHQGAKKLLSQGVLDALDKKKKGQVQETAFVNFFKTCEMKDEADDRMSPEDAGRLFAHLDEKDQGFLSKEQFLNLIRKFMKVVRASILTEDTSIKSKPLRRLDEGEVLVYITGPVLDEGGEINRFKVKAMLDDQEGWVTPAGNRGTVFLEDGGDKFKVVKETILTAALEMGGDGKTDRKLKVGEILELQEWEKKEETSGLMRMKVRVKSDGTSGYVTSKGNTGIAFVQAM